MQAEHVLENQPVLETERLLLRKVTASNAADMYAYGSDPAVSEFVTWPAHQSMEDTRQFLDIILDLYESNKAVFWGIELKEEKKLIGTINYVSWQQNHHVGEIGYVLARPYWARGIMSEAAKEVIRFGFEQMELERIEAKCLIDNEGSARVMQKAGMQYEGTFRKKIYIKGQQHDVKQYAIVKEDLLGD
ncbi:GNAT family protein [Terribacillus saccharophilus]|uniref:GNAT family N-acetyltransferase n=1 Tax=Terribacillus saccharophilus TaxID=361277 RepID=UPI003982B447